LSGGFFRLDIRQPQMIGPAVSADLDVMAAAVVSAVEIERLERRLNLN
jgi:hypothetical protein